MGFSDYQFAEKAKEREKKKQLHPVWRGVGCLLILGLSVGGYLFGGWFLQANAQNNWLFLPREIIRPSFLPGWVPAGLMVQVILALLFMLLSYGFVSFFYALLFPRQLGETDVPPLRRERRKDWRSRGR